MECNCWRKGHGKITKGEALPNTIEGMQTALDMRDELIAEQRKEISALKHKVNQLRQKNEK